MGQLCQMPGRFKDAGCNSGTDASDGSTAGLFKGELAFEGVKDGLDPLPDAAGVSEAWFIVVAVGADQCGGEIVGGECFEVAAGKPRALSMVPEKCPLVGVPVQLGSMVS